MDDAAVVRLKQHVLAVAQSTPLQAALQYVPDQVLLHAIPAIHL
jgi:hypothetical protein